MKMISLGKPKGAVEAITMKIRDDEDSMSIAAHLRCVRWITGKCCNEPAWHIYNGMSLCKECLAAQWRVSE